MRTWMILREFGQPGALVPVRALRRSPQAFGLATSGRAGPRMLQKERGAASHAQYRIGGKFQRMD